MQDLTKNNAELKPFLSERYESQIVLIKVVNEFFLIIHIKLTTLGSLLHKVFGLERSLSFEWKNALAYFMIIEIYTWGLSSKLLRIACLGWVYTGVIKNAGDSFKSHLNIL